MTVGTRLGPYELRALIGAGGMGEVYRAADSRLGRTVAAKILPPGVATPARLQRFEQEARAPIRTGHGVASKAPADLNNAQAPGWSVDRDVAPLCQAGNGTFFERRIALSRVTSGTDVTTLVAAMS
jgi:hypothetical protein